VQKNPGGVMSNGIPFTVGTEEVAYYHTDAIGSVRMVTGHGGYVWARHDYQPFGVEMPPAGGAERLRFGGKEHDPETGASGWQALDYFGARYLHSGSGRFTSVDPIPGRVGDPQTWNRYVYVTNNPLRYIDPDGRYRFAACNGADCESNQGAFVEALRLLRAAADSFPEDSEGRKAIEASLAAIGEMAGSGATIEFGYAGRGKHGDNYARANPVTKRITLNMAQMRATSRAPEFLAATVGHEGRHLGRMRLLGAIASVLRGERPSYETESFVYWGLNFDDPEGYLWKNAWSAEERDDEKPVVVVVTSSHATVSRITQPYIGQ
jgi:RHS repeat-associated protein